MKDGTFRNSNINWIFLQITPMQNHSKLSITEKRQKVEHLNNLSLWRRPAYQALMKALNIYLKCFSSGSPRKSLSKSIRYICQTHCIWSRRTETMLEISKNIILLEVIINSIIYKFFKEFLTTERRQVAISCRSLPNILE